MGLTSQRSSTLLPPQRSPRFAQMQSVDTLLQEICVFPQARIVVYKATCARIIFRISILSSSIKNLGNSNVSLTSMATLLNAILGRLDRCTSQSTSPSDKTDFSSLNFEIYRNMTQVYNLDGRLIAQVFGNRLGEDQGDYDQDYASLSQPQTKTQPRQIQSQELPTYTQTYDSSMPPSGRTQPPGQIIQQWDPKNQTVFFVDTATGVSTWTDPRLTDTRRNEGLTTAFQNSQQAPNGYQQPQQSNGYQGTQQISNGYQVSPMYPQIMGSMGPVIIDTRPKTVVYMGEDGGFYSRYRRRLWLFTLTASIGVIAIVFWQFMRR